MNRKNLLGLATAAVLFIAGVAAAGNGSAQWSYFRSDLVRCADTTTFGHPACGTATTGTDPLQSGWIIVQNASVTVRLSGAPANTAYSVAFVRLHNSGADVSGPYTVGSVTTIGSVTTNSIGSASKTFTNAAPSGPTLGYWVLYHPNVSNEFVTGFDPAP